MGVRRHMGQIAFHRGHQAQGARGLSLGLHQHQGAAHVGMVDDGARAGMIKGGLALATVRSIFAGLLQGALRDRHPLNPDRQAG